MAETPKIARNDQRRCQTPHRISPTESSRSMPCPSRPAREPAHSPTTTCRHQTAHDAPPSGGFSVIRPARSQTLQRDPLCPLRSPRRSLNGASRREGAKKARPRGVVGLRVRLQKCRQGRIARQGRGITCATAVRPADFAECPQDRWARPDAARWWAWAAARA